MTNKSKRAAKSASIVPSNAVVVIQESKSKKNKNKRNTKSKKGRSITDLLERHFFKGMTCPDLTGPFRQPRFGGADRTGLAMDRSKYNIVGSAINYVQGMQVNSGFTNGPAYSYAVATPTSALGTPTVLGVGSQFPNSGAMADVNITAASINIYYAGSVFNASGEVIIGSCLPASTAATYNSLYYYPGTISIPVASLVDRPLRVPLRKLSESANEFLPPTSNYPDVDLPFVFTYNLAVGQSIIVEIVRTYEYRSTTADGSVVTYEKVGASTLEDVSAWQEATSRLANLASPAMDLIPEFASSLVASFAETAIPQLGGMAAHSLVSMMSSRLFGIGSKNRAFSNARIEL